MRAPRSCKSHRNKFRSSYYSSVLLEPKVKPVGDYENLVGDYEKFVGDYFT